MRKIFTTLLFFISISLFSQDEKRLALVIGNANYDKGELKNPVNDARLIASTLDSLDFDVILKENLATKRDMTAAIREFGSKRSDYDVAFVYYAGHGIQVDDENFLLPTKEVFEEEFDVMDYGVSVQNIMRYLRAQTNEVNILILDACRDNPFESNWNTTRSLKGGGLAKIPPPTGSLIAFSTDSGQTAPDGDGDNSTYSVSLAKNMLLEDTSIDQVFRNVRAEVLSETDGMQRPVEATQLTGQTFYLVQSNYDIKLKEVESVLDNFDNPYFSETDFTGELYESLEKLNVIISEDPKNIRALFLSSNIYYQLNQNEKALSLVNQVIEINDSYVPAYQFRSGLWDYDDPRAILDSDKAIELDPQDISNIYSKIRRIKGENEDSDRLSFINEALKIHPNDTELFRQKGVYHWYLGENKLALEAYSKAIELDPKNGFLYMMKGNKLFDLEKYDDALKMYNAANTIKPDEPSPYYSMIYTYFTMNEYENIIKLCNKLIDIDSTDPEPYYHLSNFYKVQNENFKAVTFLSIAIFKKVEKYNYYMRDSEKKSVYLFDLFIERAKLYKKLEVSSFACNDLNDALEDINMLEGLTDKELKSSEIEFWDSREYLQEKKDELKKLILENCN